MYCSILTVFVDYSLDSCAERNKDFCVSPSCPLIVEEIVDRVQICPSPVIQSCHTSCCLCCSSIVEEIVEMVQILPTPVIEDITTVCFLHQQLCSIAEGRRRLPKQRRTVPHCEEGHGPTLQEGPLVASVVLQRLLLPLIVEEIVQICLSSVIEVFALCATLVVFGVVGSPWDKPSGGAWVPRV